MKSEIERKFETTGFRLAHSENKYTLPDIIIEPLLDDSPDWELIYMGIIPNECLL